jgi:hypothetical protein
MTHPSQIRTPFLIRPLPEWASLLSSEFLFSSYPHHPASPQAMPWHHHPLIDSLFHYHVSTRISQRLNPSWIQVTSQPNLISPTVELTWAPTWHMTWLRYRSNSTPMPPHSCPTICHLVKPPRGPCAVLCPCSTPHQTTLSTSGSSPCCPVFPFLLEHEPKPEWSSFPKSKPTQNQNQILKRKLKDFILNFKDPFVLNFDLNLQIHLFLIPSFYF